MPNIGDIHKCLGHDCCIQKPEIYLACVDCKKEKWVGWDNYRKLQKLGKEYRCYDCAMKFLSKQRPISPYSIVPINPKVGDICFANLVGKNTSNHYEKCIWAKCERCGYERWIYIKGINKPSSNICKYCVNGYGKLNTYWKGDDVGYCGIHRWVERYKLKPKYCECCGKVPPYDLANISGEYKRDLDDWEWLCRRCHMTKDGRMNNLKQYQ